MGFSSWECNGCGHPLLSEWVTTEVNAWMKHAVVVTPQKTTIEGRYNGYAHVETPQLEEVLILPNEGDPCVWHKACWNKAGQPTAYAPSTPAMDQGYFFNQTTGHQMEEPDGK